jgi:hypothetical protein
VGGHTRAAILTLRRCDLKRSLETCETAPPYALHSSGLIGSFDCFCWLALCCEQNEQRLCEGALYQARVSHSHARRSEAVHAGVRAERQLATSSFPGHAHPVQRSAPYGDQAYRRLLGPSELFDKAGYIFVYQDVRGRFQSEGQFVDMRPHREQPSDAEADESRDMADTVDCLLKNVPGSNGKVGVWGISYPGF